MEKENLLAKWLSGDITPEELQVLKKLEDLPAYEKIVEKTSQFNAPDYDHKKQLDTITSRMKTPDTAVKKLIPWKMLSGIAAAVVFIAGAFMYYQSFSDTVISTAYAEKKTLTLPDNSEVILNADSEISYNKKNWYENKEIKLGGEAFFKVEQGRIFSVITTSGTVTVVGTQFNVKNRKDFFEVSCYEGKVEVHYNNNGHEKLLNPGESFQVIKGTITSTLPFSNSQPWWTSNQSLFLKIPYELVLDEYQRIFNVEIETKNIDTNYHFTGEFSHSDKKLALNTITRPLNLSYEWVNYKKVIIYADEP